MQLAEITALLLGFMLIVLFWGEPDLHTLMMDRIELQNMRC